MKKNRPEGLENFEEVWKRVQSSKKSAGAQPSPLPGNTVIMPRRDKCRCGKRFIPPR